MSIFTDEVIAQITGHMNADHAADSLLMVQANGYPQATAATMTGLDAEAGYWQVIDPQGEHELKINWPDAPISERSQVRQQIVVIFREAKMALQPPFSQVVREHSWGRHAESEGADFMANIMRGQASLQDYIDLVAQHYFLYAELERACAKLDTDPRTAAFAVPALLRLSALKRDLEHFYGADWQSKIAPVPATVAYNARIREVAESNWQPGLVAHHYTRYLGDLSGGQMIAKRMRQQHNLDSDGVAFYEFNEIADLKAFKDEYRGWLDELGLVMSTGEQEKFLEEVAIAYDFNTQMFIELAAAKQD